MRSIIILLLGLLSAPAFAETSDPTDTVVQSAVNGVIRPNILANSRESFGMVRAMEALCAAPSELAVTVAQTQFKKTVLAHARIEVFRVGPLMEENRSERLLFWPDRKGIALRQVQALLAEKDEAATITGNLRQKSAGLQGLNALEYVLFGTDAETLSGAEGDYRCRFGLTVAQSINMVAQEMAAGWFQPNGVARRLMAPSAEYADYRTPTEATEELVNMLSHGAELVRDTRINPFIDKGDGRSNPKQALFWRSGMTMGVVHANLDALRDLFVVSGIGRKADPTGVGLSNTIEFEFRNAERAMALVKSPPEEAVVDKAQANALRYLVIVTNSLQTLVGEQLAGLLGLSVGFSSLDRD